VTAGPEAVELAALAGLVLDPWQALVLADGLGMRDDDQWSAREVGLLVSRQNGKGAVTDARELAGLFLFEERLLIHSAHEFKTAQEAFLRIKALVDNTDYFRKRVKTIRTSHGEEGIELLSGQRLRFLARSRGSGRGFTGDTIVLDEAQELAMTAMRALRFTLRARPNPQIWYTGTVPEPENNSEQWTSLRDRGRAGDSGRLAWLEWSPAGSPGWDELSEVEQAAMLDDRDAWADGNPALGYRVSVETVEHDRDEMRSDEIGFAREALSIWPDASAVRRFADLWVKLTDAGSKPVDPVSFGVHVPREREVTAISCAARRADGSVHVELVDRRPGTGWVVDRLVELRERWSPCAVVVANVGPAASLVPVLQRVGIDPVCVSVQDVARASGALYDVVVEERGLHHTGQRDLDGAVKAATKRPMGQTWVWDAPDPFMAVVLAYHGLVTYEAKSGARVRWLG